MTNDNGWSFGQLEDMCLGLSASRDIGEEPQEPWYTSEEIKGLDFIGQEIWRYIS